MATTGESAGPAAAGLAVQDLSRLDISTLTPLSPEVISRQATINIGTRSCLSSLLFTFSKVRLVTSPTVSQPL